MNFFFYFKKRKMSFSQMLRNFVKDCKTCSIDEFFINIGVSSIEEAQGVYIENRKLFVGELFYCVVPCGYYFCPFLSQNRDFLNQYTGPVKDYSEFITQKSNGDLFAPYEEWKGKKFEYGDFTLEDVVCLVNILKDPPFPLTRHPLDDNIRENKKLVLSNLNRENIYRVKNSVEKLLDVVLSGKRSGDFRFNVGDRKFYVHSWILDEYEFFHTMMNSGMLTSDDSDDVKYSVSLPTESVNAGILFIKFLYGCQLDYSNIDKNDTRELYTIADFFRITSLLEICDILLIEGDFAEEFLIRNIANKIGILIRRYVEDLEFDDVIKKSKDV